MHQGMGDYSRDQGLNIVTVTIPDGNPLENVSGDVLIGLDTCNIKIQQGIVEWAWINIGGGFRVLMRNCPCETVHATPVSCRNLM